MMSQGEPPGDDEDGGGGYGRPPKATRFTKGQRSNPAGRPPGRRREAPYEAVLGQMVTIREGGVERRVTAEEAFLLQLAKSGIEGGGAATRTALGLIEEITARRSTHGGFISSIVRMIVAPGSVTSALAPLRMAKKLDAYRETARMALEPWLVEAALARLNRKLSPADQRTIVKATRTPRMVKWPEWWSEYP
ncbi:MAG TPA: DUF5681 domain-containing protein [Bradyrhizobium sp.]|jgi:hypothetical protein